MSRIMAHRGARNLWAENSLYGFRNTVEHRFDAVEFDLHLTDAGEVVVIHDAALDRTTNGTGLVRDLTPESRKALRLKGPDGALIEEGVPSFAEALEVLSQQADLELWVELKSDENGVPYPGLVEKAAAELRRFGLAARSALHSFDISVVREIKDKAPEMKRLISVDRKSAESHGGILALIESIGDLVDIIGIHHELFDAHYEAIIARRPIEACSVWTINTPELMRHWIARNPGFLVSDNPVLLRDVLAEAAR